MKPGEPMSPATPDGVVLAESVARVRGPVRGGNDEQIAETRWDRGYVGRARAVSLRQMLVEEGLSADRADELLRETVYDATTSDMMMVDDLGPRWASTPKLRKLIRDGTMRGFNRRYTSPDDVPLLDPRGTHVVIPMLVHRYIDEKPVRPHIRARVLMKTLTSHELQEVVLDFEEASLRKLARVRPKRQRKPDPTWQQVLELYVEIVEQTRRNPAAIGWKRDSATEQVELLPEDALASLEPWYVTDDMLTLVEAAAPGVVSYPLKLPDLVTDTGFLVLERPIYIDHPVFGEVPVRVFTWKPILTHNGSGLRVYTFLDLDQYDGSDIDPTGYQSRLWPAMHWDWPEGETTDAPLLWSHITEPEAMAILELRKALMALWLLSGQRVALVSGQKPVRSFRRQAQRLSLPSTVLVVKLRRAAPQRYEDGDPRQVLWSHRWIVGGHWRHLWDKDRQEVRLTWVNSYVKGPPDKPLIIKDRLYKFDR